MKVTGLVYMDHFFSVYYPLLLDARDELLPIILPLTYA